MQRAFDKIKFVCGDADMLSEIAARPALLAFDERATFFLTALSSQLLSLKEAKAYPDVVSFAFWCRKANLSALKAPYLNEHRLGRGVAFHIAPSNVPVNFAYTLAAGMLAGNANIVRLPSKDFPQANLICSVINELLELPEYLAIAKRLCLVRYDHSSEITDALSSLCSSRVIWGGDKTVDEIRKSPIPARTNEITFPDRHSLCVINADKYLAEHKPSKVAKDFFNDTYLTDQNACTSPRIIIWFGHEIEKAKEIFWSELEKLVETDYELRAVQTVGKLTTFFKFASQAECTYVQSANCKITRVAISKITETLLEHFENSGYFYEYDAALLDEIMPLCNHKCQTLSYIGFDACELRKIVLDSAPFGIDRVVAVGKTMDFSLIWDGIDIIRTLSREITI
jgi:hypothetical protein